MLKAPKIYNTIILSCEHVKLSQARSQMITSILIFMKGIVNTVP